MSHQFENRLARSQVKAGSHAAAVSGMCVSVAGTCASVAVDHIDVKCTQYIPCLVSEESFSYSCAEWNMCLIRSGAVDQIDV